MQALYYQDAQCCMRCPCNIFCKKNIKGHSGYFGCDKCVQEGQWNNKMTFPDITAELRMDVSFLQQKDEEHHRGLSPL